MLYLRIIICSTCRKDREDSVASLYPHIICTTCTKGNKDSSMASLTLSSAATRRHCLVQELAEESVHPAPTSVAEEAAVVMVQLWEQPGAVAAELLGAACVPASELAL